MIIDAFKIDAIIALIQILTALGILYAAFAVKVYQWWKDDFSGKRLNRSVVGSPSNGQPPDVKKWSENKENILFNSKHHENFDDCELLADLVDTEARQRENRHFRDSLVFKQSLYTQKKSSSPAKEEKLDMDHVYIEFFDYLWGCTFIGVGSLILKKWGTIWLSIRIFLVKYGILKVKPFDINIVIGKLCLEQSQAIHYYARTKRGSKLGDVAGFLFADFPYIDQDSKYQVADLLAVDIDLKTKKFVKAKLDDTNLTASETLILLWFNTISTQHVKLHALANWGINLNARAKEANPFLHRNSVVTTMYNYFGYSCFSSYMEEWERNGLLKAGFDPSAWIDCVDHGIRENIWQHPLITELVPHSKFVKFIVEVRKIFFNEFAKHKDMFPGIHAEGMFVGTILHSLDHTLMDWNLEDPLWLDVDDPKFGRMAQIGRIVKAGFVKDVPLLYFHKRFAGCGHPFYENVYKKAAKIDKNLADNMDTCIIK